MYKHFGYALTGLPVATLGVWGLNRGLDMLNQSSDVSVLLGVVAAVASVAFTAVSLSKLYSFFYNRG